MSGTVEVVKWQVHTLSTEWVGGFTILDRNGTPVVDAEMAVARSGELPSNFQAMSSITGNTKPGIVVGPDAPIGQLTPGQYEFYAKYGDGNPEKVIRKIKAAELQVTQ